MRELDYRLEAQNMGAIGANLASFPRIVVPQPIADYSTTRVLTMNYISGQKITAAMLRVQLVHAPGHLVRQRCCRRVSRVSL